ncbi:MAG: hypothetical protein NTY68_01585 [Candidatus Micrarchaeota archaeon]|nr:hypothetical protein [Candidatus Micrarchaeota archaeon]
MAGNEIEIALDEYRENELKYRDRKITKEKYEEKKRDILKLISIIEKGVESLAEAKKEMDANKIYGDSVVVKAQKEPSAVIIGKTIPTAEKISKEEPKVAAAAPKKKAVAKD